MILTRHTTNGVRWLEVNGGEMDVVWHDGLASVNFDYARDGLRNPIGIRWKIERPEEFPSEDVRWLQGID